MAFKNIGPIVFLAPGATATWIYSYSTDMGPQFACADIKFMGRGGGGHEPIAQPDIPRSQSVQTAAKKR